MTLEKHGSQYDPRLAGHRDVEGVVVVDVGQSEAIRKWNNENPDCVQEIGYVIIEVNGLTDPRDMLDQMRQAPKVSLLVNSMITKDQWALSRYCRKKHERETKVVAILEEVLSCRGEICAICHDAMDSSMDHGCAPAKLPRGHQFHKTCVKDWLIRGKLRCPLCNCGVQLPSGSKTVSEKILEPAGQLHD